MGDEHLVGGGLIAALVTLLLLGLLGFLVAGCVEVSQSQVVTVRILPAETPAPGCGAIALGAAPAGPDSVVLDLAPQGVYQLLDGLVSLGPVQDGDTVTLGSGGHLLQATSGPCSSNRVAVEVP